MEGFRVRNHVDHKDALPHDDARECLFFIAEATSSTETTRWWGDVFKTFINNEK